MGAFLQKEMTIDRRAGAAVPRQKGRKMTRTEQNIYESWDEETKDFDWEKYQELCDIADYWDCEE